MGEEKEFSLYTSRFLAEIPPVIKNRLTGEKQKFNNMNTSCICGSCCSVIKSFLTLCDPMNCSMPGSTGVC